MASTEVAVRHVVRFRPPRWREKRPEIPLVLPLPKNTMDPRWRACADHHPACDCREAELAENLAEVRWERDHMLRVMREELAGHATWAYRNNNERDLLAECKCTGCVIVRRIEFASIGGTSITRSSEPGRNR
ncbi:hypothetical protein SAMN05421874_12878 [Nonomuraea maritima]|uniref:Uncharacterized protein n=1 Tax=Nonomuraea maritima TaxID=683260 RepID=A0A1G9MLH8_9ACTN|nr:hypothetical protein [Nonomuraea maritima]SDL74757.1 hypothetical protein SAMN05421874_12878 [Nonomuraea maritima]